MGIVSSPTSKSTVVIVIAILHAIYLALFVTESGVFACSRPPEPMPANCSFARSRPIWVAAEAASGHPQGAEVEGDRSQRE
jgi:hypothetical protein